MRGCIVLSEVLDIRVPGELRRMFALRDMVDWRREIIAFLEERVGYHERLRALREVEEVLGVAWSSRVAPTRACHLDHPLCRVGCTRVNVGYTLRLDI